MRRGGRCPDRPGPVLAPAGLVPDDGRVMHLESFGPYFALAVGPQVAPGEQAGEPAGAGRWQPAGPYVAREVEHASEDVGERARAGAARTDVIGRTAGARRVAQSECHLGHCARLLSPWVGWVEAYGWAPDLTLDALWCVPGASPSALRLGVARLDPLGGPGEFITRLLNPLAHTWRGPASMRWGNVASALNGAVSALAWARQEPPRSATVALVQQVLDALPDGPHADGRVGAPSFRRRSCCQLYRVEPGWGLCGDCVLRARTH